MNTKALIALGALVGFVTGAGFGLAGSSPWPAAFWRACATALAAALLVRWWGRMWMANWRDALAKRPPASPETPAPPARNTKL